MTTPYYTLYRNTKLGSTLEEAIEDLIEADRITDELKQDILSQFDKSISDALAEKATNTASFKGHCMVFKQPAPTVRNFHLDSVKFKVDGREVEVDFVNIIACEATASKEKTAGGGVKKGGSKDKKKKLAPPKNKKRKNV
ncbi:transcription initiation factor TFIIA small subunit [Acrasis kona]|uniref:Transcription initiation factor TFIIA small subunit n=1 Tax=Acrasis kona TaxID=1008807 RepID=A0AAW2Z409_9EUKA